MTTSSQNPTNEEQERFAIKAFRGVDVGLGQNDPVADISHKLEQQYPGHLILVQAGTFLHGYDRTAYSLSVLKKYRLKLVGNESAPHLRIGFPAGNFKRRLWPVVDEFGIPYVVALGSQAKGYAVYISDNPNKNIHALLSVSENVVQEVIEDLRQRGSLNHAAAKQLLENGDSGFQLKSQAQDLDTLIVQDLMRMPRDLRATWGENVRQCMAQIMRAVMAYGLEDNKPQLLKSLSAEVDLLKHYLAQAPKISQLKIAFEHRVGLAVELGRLVGGLIRSSKCGHD